MKCLYMRNWSTFLEKYMKLNDINNFEKKIENKK